MPSRSRKSTEWTYVLLTIAAFVFTPELRRIVDWRGGFDPLNAFAVIPLLMLCPIAVIAYSRRRSLRKSAFPAVALTWAGGFAYALFIGTARGALFSGLYAGAQFVLPAVIGFWLLTRPETMEVSHKRLAHWLLMFGALAGVYGILQYILAPPWDTTWMQNAAGEAFGKPERFGIRVFGVLNSPGTYALFLGSVLLINLPFLTARTWGNLAAVLFIVLGLLLSLVRSGWLAVMVGVVIFVLLSPRRVGPILTLTYVALLCAGSTVAFLVFVPNKNFTDTLLTRFGTLGAIGDDGSAADRQATSMAALQTALEQPIGAGLGLTGGSSKLQSTASSLAGAPPGPIDNGFVSRFFEMGALGFGAFIAACAIAIVAALRAYRRSAADADPRAMQLIAACVAVECAVFLLNFTGDDQQGVLGVIFFIAVALPMLADDTRPLRFRLGRRMATAR